MSKEHTQSIQDKADRLRGKDLVDPYPDTLSAVERSTASEAFALYSVRSNVPREYLWGRQLPQEYTRSPEYRVKSLFFQMGKRVLEEKPVWAVLNPTSQNTKELVIVDGHKRTRYSALFGITDIPTDVIDLEHLASAWNQTPEQLSSELRKQIDLAQWSFVALAKARGKIFPAPRSIPHHLNAVDLSNYFQSQERNTQVEMHPNQTYVLHGRR